MNSQKTSEEGYPHVQVKIKRLRGQNPLPKYETRGASGMDLRASLEEEITLQPGEYKLIPTGIAISMPEDLEAQVRPRSGLALKYGIGLLNSPGTIDADYRGEIGVILINFGKAPFVVKDGDRIAQLVFSKVVRVEVVEGHDLDKTERGSGGFGHTGRQ